MAGKSAALAKPQTFMNVNGPAVKGLLERYGVKPESLIVVYDELALPWGDLRIRVNRIFGRPQRYQEFVE